MLENLLVVVLVILSFIMVGVILLQPDRSQGMVKSSNLPEMEKEGIEKFTEIIAALFLVAAILFQIVR